MPNIKETAKNILYICKRWIAGKLYIISVWTKDKIAEIKNIMSHFLQLICYIL